MSQPVAKYPEELSGFAFAAAPLPRADALRGDAVALQRMWGRAQVMVLDEAGQALADEAGNLHVLRGHEVSEGPGAALLIGVEGEQAWFAVDATAIAAIAAPGRVDLRRAAAAWPAPLAGAFAFARAMQHWRSRTRYCGVCAAPIEFIRAGYVARCSGCGLEQYPRVDPAIIVAVSDGERLLLGRQAAWPERRYSVLAGFVEPAESLEQTVVREVLEETRVRVRSCRYLGAQPWPFPGALMLGFVADAEPDEPQVDGELEDARWFTAAEIGEARHRHGEEGAGLLLSPRISIARSLINYWYQSVTAATAGR